MAKQMICSSGLVTSELELGHYMFCRFGLELLNLHKLPLLILPRVDGDSIDCICFLPAKFVSR